MSVIIIIIIIIITNIIEIVHWNMMDIKDRQIKIKTQKLPK